MKRNTFKLFLITAGMSLLASPAFGEVLSGVGSYDPGQIDNSNFTQLKEYQARVKYEATKDPAVIEEEVKQKMDLLNTKQVKFTLNDIEIEGNTVFPTYVLMRLVDFKIGQRVTINDLIMSANDITDYYQGKGYLSTIAYLPPQKVEKGKVKIVVMEGKYGNVQINPGRWERSSFLNRAYLDDNDIKPGSIVNANTLRKTLQSVNAEDYMKGSVSFTDNEENEEYSDVSLDIKDRFPIDLDIRYDNQGRDLIGTQRGVLYAGLHNVTGHGDKLLGTLAFTKRSIGVGGLYSIPIAKNDTKLNLGYTYSHVKLGKQLKEYDITGSSHNFFVGVSRRLARGENYRLYGDLTFDFRNSDSHWKYDNQYELPGYRTRTLRASVTDIADDFYGRWLFNGAVTTGIPFLDGTDHHKNRAYASNNFVKLNAGVARMQMLPLNSMALLQVNGQYANRNLFASEKLQVGGIASVRGFDEAYALGDYGLTASIEYRFPVPFLRLMLPEKLKFIDDSIRVAAFYDFGWFGDRFNSDGSDYMMSVGPGIVVKLTKYLSGNVYWGFPVGHRPGEVDTCRFHFTVTSNIL